jgi:hypothetical protein
MTNTETIRAHSDPNCGCDGCRIGYKIDRTREHVHTCLNCENVVGVGGSDCESNSDHDFALCDECADTYRVQCDRCGTVRDASRRSGEYAPPCDCGATQGTEIR